MDHYLFEENQSADMHYLPDMVKVAQEETKKIAQMCNSEGHQEPYEHELVLARTDPSETASVEEAINSTCAFSIVQQHFLINKKTVVERDTDLLTKEELREHEQEVAAAILAELKTWIKFKCFCRRKKATARNVVDCKWVIKWKNEVLPDGTSRRIIRARLTIRGFKDIDAAGLEKYAGTSQRYSQRLLVSEAANRQWPIVSTDISKAFLQGVTYKELSEMTGEPLRDVCFVLLANSVAVCDKFQDSQISIQPWKYYIV